MPQLPDLADPRYLDEIGWFVYHEKYARDQFGGSYDAERRAYSRLLLEEVANYLGQEPTWLDDKTVVSIGCGCTGDLVAFPCRNKIAIDPLLYVYQKLGLLISDEVGGRTIYLSLGAEELPLLDDCADLVICRNALDHMPKPEVALKEMCRILDQYGALFLSVDIGGEATPDEPTVFSVESLRDMLAEGFELLTPIDNYPPHSIGRVCSVRFVAQKRCRESHLLDKEKILQTYETRIADETKEAAKQTDD
jgi:SAM-dependent methyltransferase